jgi:hypothetical protein
VPRIYFILFWQRLRPHTAKNNKIIRILNASLPDLLIPRTHIFSTDSGFTHLYLLHSFQGLKHLTLFIIETYTLAYQLFLISYIFYRLCEFTNRYLIHRYSSLKFTLYTCISYNHIVQNIYFEVISKQVLIIFAPE